MNKNQYTDRNTEYMKEQWGTTHLVTDYIYIPPKKNKKDK